MCAFNRLSFFFTLASQIYSSTMDAQRSCLCFSQHSIHALLLSFYVHGTFSTYLEILIWLHSCTFIREFQNSLGQKHVYSTKSLIDCKLGPRDRNSGAPSENRTFYSLTESFPSKKCHTHCAYHRLIWKCRVLHLRGTHASSGSSSNQNKFYS